VDISLLREAVQMIEGRVQTEASGNVTLETVTAIAKSGCNFISCGALTHSVKALDISFNVALAL
jgi:nicotinate-nucleotide pyrophosphorylase (carboxylating)